MSAREEELYQAVLKEGVQFRDVPSPSEIIKINNRVFCQRWDQQYRKHWSQEKVDQLSNYYKYMRHMRDISWYEGKIYYY